MTHEWISGREVVGLLLSTCSRCGVLRSTFTSETPVRRQYIKPRGAPGADVARVTTDEPECTGRPPHWANARLAKTSESRPADFVVRHRSSEQIGQPSLHVRMIMRHEGGLMHHEHWTCDRCGNVIDAQRPRSAWRGEMEVFLGKSNTALRPDLCDPCFDIVVDTIDPRGVVLQRLKPPKLRPVK